MLVGNAFLWGIINGKQWFNGKCKNRAMASRNVTWRPLDWFYKDPKELFTLCSNPIKFFILCRDLKLYRLKINLFWKQIGKNSVIKASYKVWGTITIVSKKHASFHYNLNKETYLVGIDHCSLSPSVSNDIRLIWGWRMWPKVISTPLPKQLPASGRASLVWFGLLRLLSLGRLHCKNYNWLIILFLNISQ